MFKTTIASAIITVFAFSGMAAASDKSENAAFENSALHLTAVQDQSIVAHRDDNDDDDDRRGGRDLEDDDDDRRS